jgi:hypothetical protein
MHGQKNIKIYHMSFALEIIYACMHHLTPVNINIYFLQYSLFIRDISQSFHLTTMGQEVYIFSSDTAMTLPLTFDSTDTNFGNQ